MIGVDLAALERSLDIDLVGNEVQIIRSSTLAAIAAQAPFAGGVASWTPLRPLLVVADDDTPGSIVAATLSPIVGPGTNARMLRRDETTSISTIADLAAEPFRALLIHASDPLTNGRDPRALQQILARLRAPDGCPWDRKQTLRSLRGSLIDEVYEAVDAIDAGDTDNLAEELGDLMVVIMMLGQIAREADAFTLEDVWHGAAVKIVGRHPHVFGDAVAESADDVLGVWAAAKARERAANPELKREKDHDGEPRSMPALERAGRVLRKRPLGADPVADESAAGDELLALVARLQVSGIDADRALRSALNRYVTAANQQPSEGEAP